MNKKTDDTPKANSRPGVTRRDLLKASAAAAMSIPYFIPASALGKAGRPAPSNRIVMGGIGIGNQGSGDQSSYLGHDQVQYVALADVKQNVRESAKNRVDRHYGDTACA